MTRAEGFHVDLPAGKAVGRGERCKERRSCGEPLELLLDLNQVDQGQNDPHGLTHDQVLEGTVRVVVASSDVRAGELALGERAAIGAAARRAQSRLLDARLEHRVTGRLHDPPAALEVLLHVGVPELVGDLAARPGEQRDDRGADVLEALLQSVDLFDGEGAQDDVLIEHLLITLAVGGHDVGLSTVTELGEDLQCLLQSTEDPPQYLVRLGHAERLGIPREALYPLDLEVGGPAVEGLGDDLISARAIDREGVVGSELPNVEIDRLHADLFIREEPDPEVAPLDLGMIEEELTGHEDLRDPRAVVRSQEALAVRDYELVAGGPRQVGPLARLDHEAVLEDDVPASVEQHLRVHRPRLVAVGGVEVSQEAHRVGTAGVARERGREVSLVGELHVFEAHELHLAVEEQGQIHLTSGGGGSDSFLLLVARPLHLGDLQEEVQKPGTVRTDVVHGRSPVIRTAGHKLLLANPSCFSPSLLINLRKVYLFVMFCQAKLCPTSLLKKPLH